MCLCCTNHVSWMFHIGILPKDGGQWPVVTWRVIPCKVYLFGNDSGMINPEITGAKRIKKEHCFYDAGKTQQTFPTAQSKVSCCVQVPGRQQFELNVKVFKW